MNTKVQQFIKNYQLFEEDQVQQIQLQHRFDLAKAFGVRKGMRILEIGCGQGDTTVVLADLVGEEGHIVAIDIAKGDYDTKIRQARKFFDQGNKVRFSFQFRGREITHFDLFEEMAKNIIEELSDVSKVDVKPEVEGRKLFFVLSSIVKK